MRWLLLIPACLLIAANGYAYTRQDTLRGSNGRGRDWWDVLKYDLTIQLDTSTKTIRGTNTITFRVIREMGDSMQIDWQIQDGTLWTPDKRLKQWMSSSNREGNVHWIPMAKELPWKVGQIASVTLRFEGKPRQAVNPPWDGGFIWTKDSMGNPWISVACQGLGASSWWPCKDYQGDEPDSGMSFFISRNDRRDSVIREMQSQIQAGLPYKYDPLIDTSFSAVGNGKQDAITVEEPMLADYWNEYLFTVQNPINTYNTTFYIGDYAHWHDTLHGEKGVLDLDFYPLRYNEAKARKQWAQAKKMLRCFEYWMGPYPFYEDGYKLVEAPFLGMEHQSAIAYGNQYRNGYYKAGKGHIDRSSSGVGFSFDFIIIHESGHEWFGNSITAQDAANNWLHEGFTTYTETLFAEWIKGKDSAFAYTMGQWQNIKNDRPVIGDYGVNKGGSSDKYDKGSAVVHMIRMMLNDDRKFRQLLRGLNQTFYHKIVTSKEVEAYISKFVGLDLSAFFDVYLRSTTKPVLEWKYGGDDLSCRWTGVPEGFVDPIAIEINGVPTVAIARSTVTRFRMEEEVKDLRVKACGWYSLTRK